MELEIRTSYRVQQVQRSEPRSPILNPILGLSALELEDVLDRSLAAVQEFYQQEPEYHSRGNYFTHPSFLQICKSVQGSVSEQRYLERPQVLVSENCGNYGIMYNPFLDESIYAKLEKFKDQGSDNPGNFSRQFLHNWKWLEENQLKIAAYLCEVQRKYILSSSPFDLQEMSQQNIADHLGYSLSSANRLVQNFTLQLPDTRVIFATELITGNGLRQLQGVYALQQLSQEGILYRISDSRCNYTIEELLKVVHKQFGLEIEWGSMGSYLRILKESMPRLQRAPAKIKKRGKNHWSRRGKRS